MGKLFVKLPSMGESINEATLTSWLKDVGDEIEIDESIVEVSTDKVDSDIPSEVSGILVEKKFKVNDVIKIGEVIAVIDSENEESSAIEDSEVNKSETIDEMLSYKSINLRNFLNRYENSNLFNHKGGWGELYSTLLNRSEDSNSLAMEYNLINVGANLIYPLENSNFIMMFEGGIQDFAKDYRITYQNISGGIHIPDNDKFFNLDTFITGGVTLKDGKRKVLTNTVSSGTVDSDSNFQTYDIQLGAKKNNLNIIPDIGFTSSMSITPTYDESKFYSWRNRVVGNLSIYLSDDYLIRDDKEEKLNLNWALDLRSAIGDDEQTYSISGTTATYKQDNDLKREISLSASMNYEKYIFENSMIGFAYYGLLSSQNTLSLGGNAFYKMNF